ncbi:hypothetical protein Acsp06_15110 [Actinomycetospora sp. NBRC 106375]|uniref:GH25 family lysozyme n=1 Tax=Actinomycetospora sp. NBRC 106375 TaxID=3032207 RepID=UPI0024A5CADE|nr:GH25 family lysozyme [Actinomycetospora sp. NBRC 106375]GLZ45326.1 hypothetical protein Acsp06_15110 [Actinomycetospora sp. NBRC 106375]
MASDRTDFQNDDFSSAYDGAAATGMLHGAYHFALPDRSDAATQATYLLDHGGAPSGDGRTLPPMLDIEDDPYGDQCYGMSPENMVAWIRSFSDTVAARTHRLPTIYTSLRWWSACTGNSDALGDNPLFIAHYDEDVGTLPAGWEQETFWQYSDSGPLPGDQDVFHGTPEQLQALAADPSTSSGSAGSTSSSTPPTSTSTSAPPSTPPSTTSTPPSTTTPSTTTPDSPA